MGKSGDSHPLTLFDSPELDLKGFSLLGDLSRQPCACPPSRLRSNRLLQAPGQELVIAGITPVSDTTWTRPDVLFPVVSGGRTSCGGVISSLSGSFSSPRYPDNYPTDVQCVWEIHVDKRFRIKLMIPSLK